MISCDWINAPEEMLLQSSRADNGPCVSTVDYGESLWFHLFHIHEPNGSCCIIHEQIRRSKHQCEQGRMQNAEGGTKNRTLTCYLSFWRSYQRFRPHDSITHPDGAFPAKKCIFFYTSLWASVRSATFTTYMQQ